MHVAEGAPRDAAAPGCEEDAIYPTRLPATKGTIRVPPAAVKHCDWG